MAYPPKGRADYLDLGDWNCICSMCGQKRKASQLVKNWQGQWRCPEHNESRHPQDFVRAVADNQSVLWTQLQSEDYIQPTYEVEADTAALTITVNTASTLASGRAVILTVYAGVVLTTLTLVDSTASALPAEEIIINNSGIITTTVNTSAIPTSVRNWA